MRLRAASNKRRSQNGHTIAEQPAGLWLLFIGMFFPLVAMVTLGLRFTFMLLSAQEAAVQASLSRTYSTDISSTDRSAVNSARDTAIRVINKFPGVTFNNCSTAILIADTQSTNIARQTVKLNAPADTSRNLYFLETTITGTVAPFIQSSGFWSGIPGLTQPYTIKLSARKVAENPQGLNL